MPELDYLAPTSAEDAAMALAAGGGSARALSGGTDLLVQLRAGRLKAGLIVDLKRIPGAIGIRQEHGGFVIGAATPGAVIGEHAALARAWPGVVEAAMLIGSTQIQGRASMAGNLCNASPAADSVPALIAARATCVIVGPAGRRTAPVEEIAVAPGRTSLTAGEFVLEIRLPARPARSADAYLRSIPRTEMDIAVVGAGVNLTLDEAGRGHRRPRGPGRGRPHRPSRGGRGRRPGRHAGRRAGPGQARRGGAGGLPSDQRQARHRRIPHQDRRRAGPARGGHRLPAGERAGMSKQHISATVNGDPVEFLSDPGTTLLDALRDELGLTGSKEGCGSGDCGACSVIVDGRLVCSCLMLAAEAEGRRIETIEGMADGATLHPLQQKFLEHAALQCGFCTPGLLVAAKALLGRQPRSHRERDPATGWPATSAGAPATTRSSAR